MNRVVTARRFNLVCLIVSLIPVLLVALFIHSFGSRVPVYDQWERSIFLAMEARNGTLTYADLLSAHNGHRLLFSDLITVGFAVFTTWNPHQEAVMNLLLGVINFGLLALLFQQHRRRLFYLAIVPMSLLHFSLFQDFNWSVSFQSQWHLVVMFFLLGLISLTHFRPGLRPLCAAILCAFCATFSSGNGLLTWGILLGVMIWQGYRRWQHYALWLEIATLTTLFYFSDVGGTTGEFGSGRSDLALDAPLVVLRFLIAFLGAPFAHREIAIASIMGSLGLLIFAANLYYLYQARHAKKLVIWLAIAANSVGTGVLIALTRSNGDAAYLWRALLPRFTGMATQFWIATLVLMFLTTWHLTHTRRSNFSQKALFWSNGLMVLIVLAFLVYTNLWIVRQNSRAYGNGLIIERTVSPHEQCLLDFPLYRDLSCLREHPVKIRTDPDLVYALAVYRLSVFADQAPANVLPVAYQANDPIVIESQSRWLNAYMRDWMLAGVPESAIFHIAPPSEPAEAIPQPLDDVVSALTPVAETRLVRFTAQAGRVWYLTTPEQAESSDAFLAMMQARGYRITPQPITDPRYADANFRLYLCEHDLFQQQAQLTSRLLPLHP